MIVSRLSAELRRVQSQTGSLVTTCNVRVLIRSCMRQWGSASCSLPCRRLPSKSWLIVYMVGCMHSLAQYYWPLAPLEYARSSLDSGLDSS